MRKIFDGIRIIDFGWAWAIPLTTKVFSDYGAEVIRVESNSKPDLWRTHPPFKDNIAGVNRNGIFIQDNTGKLSITINLGHPRGIELAKKLISRADIVAENFSAGTMQRLGLGYDELKKVNPSVIMLSSSVQGQSGPYAKMPAWGYLLTALCGFNQISGWPDREPASLGSYTDFIAPYFNCTALLAALAYRRKTGKGMYLDMSQYENAMQFMSPLILDYEVNQHIAGRIGNRTEYAAPHAAYRCRGDDRWCAVAVFTDKEWQSFCECAGAPAWTKDIRFATLLSRKENEDEMDRLVEAWTCGYVAEEAMALLQSAGVTAGILQTSKDLLENDPQLKQSQFTRVVEHPEVGKYRASRPPFILSKLSPELRRSPLLGEHNEYVLQQVLNLPDEEIGSLIAEGVID